MLALVLSAVYIESQVNEWSLPSNNLGRCIMVGRATAKALHEAAP